MFQCDFFWPGSADQFMNALSGTLNQGLLAATRGKGNIKSTIIHTQGGGCEFLGETDHIQYARIISRMVCRQLSGPEHQ